MSSTAVFVDLATGPYAVIPLLVAAAVLDWRTYRLPNALTLGGAAAGIALSLLPGGLSPLEAIGAAAIVLLLLIPLWMLRVTGAGDVKLMAMVGTFLGMPGVLFALLFTLIAGGLAALAFALWRRNLARLFANTAQLVQGSAIAALHGMRPGLEIASVGRLPYGVCVCAGTLAWLALVHWRA